MEPFLELPGLQGFFFFIEILFGEFILNSLLKYTYLKCPGCLTKFSTSLFVLYNLFQSLWMWTSWSCMELASKLKRSGYGETHFFNDFCEIFYSLTIIAYNILSTDRTIFPPHPLSAKVCCPPSCHWQCSAWPGCSLCAWLLVASWK